MKKPDLSLLFLLGIPIVITDVTQSLLLGFSLLFIIAAIREYIISKMVQKEKQSNLVRIDLRGLIMVVVGIFVFQAIQSVWLAVGIILAVAIPITFIPLPWEKKDQK